MIMAQLLILAGLIVFTIVFSLWQSNNSKQRISEFLISRGASDIVIVWDWSGGDRGNNAYAVEYTDRRGNHCITQCKVSSGLFSSGDIYWRDPPSA